MEKWLFCDFFAYLMCPSWSFSFMSYFIQNLTEISKHWPVFSFTCTYRLQREPLHHLRQLVPVVSVYLREFCRECPGEKELSILWVFFFFLNFFQAKKKLAQLRHLAKVTCKELGVAGKIHEQFTL